MEIDLNREIVSAIINKAHEFNERDDVTPLEDESEPDFADMDLGELMSARFGTDPYYRQLKASIEDLEPDQQMTLVAMMWVGRGDYSLDEWGDALEHAEESWNDNSADYLIGTPLLADYLADALEQVEAAED